MSTRGYLPLKIPLMGDNASAGGAVADEALPCYSYDAICIPHLIYILGFSLSLFDRNDDDKGIPRGSGGSGLHSSHTRYVLFLWIDTRGKGKGLMYLYLNSKMCYICNEWEGIIP